MAVTNPKNKARTPETKEKVQVYHLTSPGGRPYATQSLSEATNLNRAHGYTLEDREDPEGASGGSEGASGA